MHLTRTAKAKQGSAYARSVEQLTSSAWSNTVPKNLSAMASKQVVRIKLENREALDDAPLCDRNVLYKVHTPHAHELKQLRIDDLNTSTRILARRLGCAVLMPLNEHILLAPAKLTIVFCASDMTAN